MKRSPLLPYKKLSLPLAFLLPMGGMLLLRLVSSQRGAQRHEEKVCQSNQRSGDTAEDHGTVKGTAQKKGQNHQWNTDGLANRNDGGFLKNNFA